MLTKSNPKPVQHVKTVAPEPLVGDKIQPGNPLFGIVWIDPQRLSGEPCFFGTRVTLKTLFDSLSAGQSLEKFLDDFEGVDREQAIAAIEFAGKHLLRDLGLI